MRCHFSGICKQIQERLQNRWACIGEGKKILEQTYCTAKTKCRKFETNIPRKGISGPQSQFPHSCVCEQIIYSHDGSVFSAEGNMWTILIIYKSLTDTWMWKLGLRPRNSQKRNIKTELPLQCGVDRSYHIPGYLCWIPKGPVLPYGGEWSSWQDDQSSGISYKQCIRLVRLSVKKICIYISLKSTLIRTVWVSAKFKFGTSTVVSVFGKCLIYTHDVASAKFST